MNSYRFTPLYLLMQVLAVVFVAEAIVMFLLPLVLPQDLPETTQAVMDSTLLTLLSAPVLWLVVIRPLRRLAFVERAKADALSAAAAEGIITFDSRGVIESFSAAAEQIFGFAATEMIGSDVGSILPWQFISRYGDGDGARPGEPRVLEGTIKIPGRRKDGSDVPLVVAIQAADVEGRRLYTAVVRNLVDRERDEMRAEQMAALAQLGTAFAHRLRNPLTAIKMLVQAGRGRGGSVSLDAADLQVMEDEILRAERSVKMFLDFARPQKPDLRLMAIAPAVGKAIAAIEPRASQKRVAIDSRCDEHHVQINADAAQIETLLQHLLQNALDAVSAGGKIQLDLQRTPAGRCEIRVCDEGAGMSADVLAQLFQPFVTSKTTGIGLGLVIARRIAEAHGGTLVASNRNGGGSCFTVSLPIATANPSAPAEVAVVGGAMP